LVTGRPTENSVKRQLLNSANAYNPLLPAEITKQAASSGAHTRNLKSSVFLLASFSILLVYSPSATANRGVLHTTASQSKVQTDSQNDNNNPCVE